jgi:peptidoglycan/LPS O-acetylase OafA/YrhL
LQFGIPSAMIVGGCIFAPSLRFSTLEKIGDWSYSLYLSHPIVLSAVCQLWRAFQPWLPIALFPLAAVLSCVAVAAAMYHSFERPVTQALKRRYRLRRLETQMAADGDGEAEPYPHPRPVRSQDF